MASRRSSPRNHLRFIFSISYLHLRHFFDLPNKHRAPCSYLSPNSSAHIIQPTTMSSTAFASPLAPLSLRPRKLTLSATRPSRQSYKTRCTPQAVQKPDMPESAKQAVARGEDVTYWQGEWICVDCGFVYKPARRVKFEDLPSAWKCPQCNAPKRRFAKKAGDLIAETASTSNTPIILFSLMGLFATVAFGIWASKNL